MQGQTRKWLDSQGEDVVPDGAVYKKLMHSWRWRPDDGKHWYEDPKSYRK